MFCGKHFNQNSSRIHKATCYGRQTHLEHMQTTSCSDRSFLEQMFSLISKAYTKKWNSERPAAAPTGCAERMLWHNDALIGISYQPRADWWCIYRCFLTYSPRSIEENPRSMTRILMYYDDWKDYHPFQKETPQKTNMSTNQGLFP